MSVVTNLIGGIFNVAASSKRKKAVKQAERLQRQLLEEQKAYEIAEVTREVKRMSGRQALAYAAGGVEITSATPQTMMAYTRRRGDEEISHIRRAADINALMLRLQSQNAQKEITFQAWNSMLGSASQGASAFLSNYSAARTAAQTPGSGTYGQTRGASALGSLW